jgi:P4 family phage/plasmid primase-like protien
MGVYYILNKVNPDLYARSANVLKMAGSKDLTSDTHIIDRRWLPLDFDAKRAAGISATNAEHERALSVAAAAHDYLINTLGFPVDSVITADSGNGAHILIRVAGVPLDKTGDTLIEDCLKGMAAIFSTKEVEVDLKVFNRARIFKAYGSLAKKGSDVPDRPYRIARLLPPIPEKIIPASLELLRKLAELKPDEPKAQQSAPTGDHRHYGKKLDLATWLPVHDIPIKKVSDWQGWVKYEPECCPFDSAHAGSSVAFFQNAEGAIKFRCEHNGCSGRTWADVRKLKEPDYDSNRRQPSYSSPPLSSDNGNGHHSELSIPAEYALDHLTTDVGNAERFVRQFRETVKYNSKRKMWLLWEGTHWAWDDNVQILVKAQETVRSIYTEAAAHDNKIFREALASWAKSSESNMRISAMLAQAKAHVPIELNELDRDGYLLNCQNGTIDLRTGQLMPHRKDDLITVMVPITYDPTAQCPKWLAFLQYITALDTALQNYFQIAVGYTLTGEVKEQIFFDCYGEQGNNGKTTFLTVLRSLAGDYGTAVPIDLFLHNNRSNAAQGHTESLANIQGKRFIMPSELEKRARLAMGLLKTLTGNDKGIKASRKGEHEIEFTPIGKIWLFGNYKPIVTETGNSFWRRLKLLPFNVTVPADKIDKNLPADLQQELSGILNWAIAGCLAWQKNGFSECDAVTDATKKYREESDEVVLFIKDACELGVGYFASKKAMKDAYVQWCDDNGHYPVRASDFSHALEDKHVSDGKQNNQRGWLGIKINYAVNMKKDEKGSVDDESPENEPFI